MRDSEALRAALAEPFDVVLHLAGQVAVTTSILDPVDRPRDQRARHVPAPRGAARAATPAPRTRRPLLIYASTNKVYGHLSRGDTIRDGRWDFQNLPTGVSEEEPLSFESPYGCSKGAADQYVVDYHRSFGLPTVAMRQSCIYGTRQFGEEDQGWVAWFALAAVFGLPITIYGDGLQVRDLLWVDDLVDAVPRGGRAARDGRRPRLQRRRRPGASACRCRSSWRSSSSGSGRPIPVAPAPTRLGDQPRLLLQHRPRRRASSAGSRASRPTRASTGCSPGSQGNREEIAAFLARKGTPRRGGLSPPA